MSSAKHIHFASLSSSVMEDLAIGLSSTGHKITCSGNGLSGGSVSRLQQHDVVLAQGPFDKGIEALVIGPDTVEDDLNIRKSLELKVPIYSVPEVIYQKSIDKQRMV